MNHGTHEFVKHEHYFLTLKIRFSVEENYVRDLFRKTPNK